MKKKPYFKPFGDYLYFSDTKDDDKYFCCNRNDYRQMLEINRTRKDKLLTLPDTITLKAYPLLKVDENQTFELFDIDINNFLDFPVNRINWIWTYGNDSFQY